MATIGEELQQALAHHRAGQLAEAERLYQHILEVDPRQADAWHLLGVLAQAAGQLDRARDLIGRAIALDDSCASYHFNLGEVHRAQGEAAAARTCYERTLRLNPAHAGAHNNLGTVLQAMGDHAGAERCFREALRHRPDYALACNNLGASLKARGALVEARQWLERALALEPNYAEAHNNLGTVRQAEGDLAAARTCFQQALRANPGHATAHHNLGVLHRANGQLAEARACFQHTIRLKPDFAEAHFNLGAVCKDCLQYTQAQACFERALALKPDYLEAQAMLGSVFELQGRFAEAQAALEKALSIKPHDALKLRTALLLPVIYSSREDLHQHRRRIEANVARLEKETLRIEDPIHTVGGTAFFLAYHGMDDRPLQASLAAIYARAAPELTFVAPHCRTAATARPRQPLRVGFLSNFFFYHTIAKLNLGFIRRLPREQFHVTVLRFPLPADALGLQVQRSADAVVTLSRQLETARRQIADLQLDVLFYTDIGMEPWSYFLAFARLAPVQCVTWGHPVTTGIPTIDYFLSNIHLEGDDTDRQYTERLVRMQHLNSYYHEPRLSGPLKGRAEFGLEVDAHVYLCPQSLFKIHPEFDPILGGILRGDPRGQVVFITGLHADWDRLLRERFRRTMPGEVDRVRFIPRVSGDDFVHLQAAADVLLDPIHFGGGNTSYEAFAVGAPIVTLPGQFLRSRITYACYKQMGVEECIAADAEDYVRIALRLGTDPEWRRQVSARIVAARHVLYENPETVRELAAFFRDAVERVSPATVGPRNTWHAPPS